MVTDRPALDILLVRTPVAVAPHPHAGPDAVIPAVPQRRRARERTP